MPGFVSPPVYHGSLTKFDLMDVAHLTRNTGAASASLGFFFASTPAVAVSYAGTTTHRLREAHSAMSQLEPRIKELTGQTFIGAVHRHRQGAYNAKPWKGELYRMLELYDEAQQTCGDVDFGYVEEFPTLAETGCLYEARLRYHNAFEFDFHGTGRGVDSTYFNLVSTAKAVGRDAVILRNTTDPGDPSGEHLTDIYVVFDASAITITARLTGEEAEEMIRQHRQQTLGEESGQEPPAPPRPGVRR